VNRYSGNGHREYIPEPLLIQHEPVAEAYIPEHKPVNNSLIDGLLGGKSSPLHSLFGGLGDLLSKLSTNAFEVEDLLLLVVLYLLYRESGDIEFLLIAGAMLLL
jgi:hypothetical protein